MAEEKVIMVTHHCAKCRGTFQLDKRFREKAKCPHCETEFDLRPVCCHCGQRISVPLGSQTKGINCSECRGLISIQVGRIQTIPA